MILAWTVPLALVSFALLPVGAGPPSGNSSGVQSFGPNPWAGSGPHISGFSFLPNPIFLGNSTSVGVNASGGVGPLSYSYSGLPPGCASANLSRFTCVPTASGIFPVNATVTDPAGARDSAVVNLTVHPSGTVSGPQITEFSAHPATISLGQSTHLIVATQGGVVPLSFAYPILPPGCTSANVTDLSCTPTANGSFQTYVEVTDSAGNRTGAFGAITVTSVVVPGPSISGFSAAPRTIRAGSPTTFFLSVSGGMPPLTYTYSGLPGGCLGVDAPLLNCTPTDPGVYPVAVSVADALGRAANSSTTLTVLPAITSTGGHGGANPGSFGGLGTPTGAAAVLFVLAAAVLFTGTEVLLRRRRLRDEGRDLVRAMSDDAAARRPEEHDR